MRLNVPGLGALCLLLCACLPPVFGRDIQGKIVDPSGAPVRGARIAVKSRVGVEAETLSGSDGGFRIQVPEAAGTALVITAPGFSTTTVAPDEAASVQLAIAPVVDSVRVVGSAIDTSAREQGSSISLVPPEDVRRRNEPMAVDLLRYLPGMIFNQSGSTGGVTSLFLRGGYSNFNLVQIDGVPVVAFGGGLGFDFAHIPSEIVDHVEVARGAQSAVYGPYANSGVVDFITRQPEGAPQIDVLAEGGSNYERRFGITATGMIAGFGVAASVSRLDTDGLVTNDAYRNEDVLLNISRRFGRQRIFLHGDFDSNEVGEPGAWGSDPKHTFTGIDTISQSKNNFSDYLARYEIDLTGRVREEVTGSYFQNNNGYRSPYGFSFNKDMRGLGEARTILSLTPHYVVAFGFTGGREEVKNAFITDAEFDTFPLDRNDFAVYLENRYEIGGRLFLNAGVRGEFFRTDAIPADGFSRPFFPKSSINTANPKAAVAYVPTAGTRLHASFGTGIRPPSGFDLAFTNNPALQPERTRSFDAGLEQRLFHNLLLLDGTWFYNRYYDLIVTLGGSLSALGHYQTANLANSRGQGAEFSASLRPSRSVFIRGSYMLLKTRILSLDGSNNLAPLPFQVGQPLTRRPENSGSIVGTYTHGRFAVDLTGYFRGRALFEEPYFGASNGLFWNPGYANFGLNLNYELPRSVTIYGNLRNMFNDHYEEIFGFPSPRLNFVAGVKWRIARAR